ncbi:MAG: transglycosylase domain-containing protein, partial [Actinobacteria bacterium]|nr:transglycosylase domain-containing protein [Actinomycetota bacterium]
MLRRLPRFYLLGLIAALAVSTTSCSQIIEIAESLPTLSKEDLRFKPVQSSFLYADDGSLITSFHGTQNRTVIPLSKIPEEMQHAVVAIEDERFYEHNGVDFKAILRAMVTNLAEGSIKEGGSTITQQYVKQAIIAPGEIAEKSYERKLQEAALARQLEEELTKDEILARYLNTVYFGEGAYGIQAASFAFFNKPAKKLSLAQSALLAGVIRSPGAYNPFGRKKVATARRNLVLAKMEELGYADAEHVDQAQNSKIKLTRAPAGEYEAPYFVDYVRRLIQYDPRFKDLGGDWKDRENLLYTGGLKIYTTVNLEMQRAAEEAVAGKLTEPSDPHASLVSIEPDSGHVKAMVGGRDWFAKGKEDPFAKFNLAIQAEPDLGREKIDGVWVKKAPGTGRQAGSAFKPFALAAALADGMSLSNTFDSRACMVFPGANAGGDWNVCNYAGESFAGRLPLLEATVHSVNVVFAQVVIAVGAPAVVELAAAMGIHTPLAAVPSAVLGSNEVNPLGMADAFATFAANGIQHDPVAITKIVDANGKILYEDSSESTEVMDPAVAYLTTTALEQVVARGTGTAALAAGRPVAGKTGTAQAYRDAWFAGFAPNLATAVWVGYPEGAIEMTTSCVSETGCRPTRIQVTGGSWPAEIWGAYMKRALSSYAVEGFVNPGGTTTAQIDSRTGCMATGKTPSEFSVVGTFIEGTAPKKPCPVPDELKTKEEKREESHSDVPDVVGLFEDDAVERLEDHGFDVDVVV